jgi:hypothetical protein
MILFIRYFVFSLVSVFSINVSADDELVYCLYKTTDFRGVSFCSDKSLSWLGWKWHRHISSVTVREGYELEVYPYWGFWGTPHILSGEQAHLGRWNNKIASIRVLEKKVPDPGKVCFFTRKNYRGVHFCSLDSQFWLNRRWNNRISSVQVPEGYRVTLYRYWAYWGGSESITENTPQLSRYLNNSASLVRIERIDTDLDSVLDPQDQCPDTPRGETVDVNGCSPSQLDEDGDGVTDALDQCPNTPTVDTPNEEGCSPEQIDTDNDGTPDYMDAFPKDPSESSDLDGDGIGDNTDIDRDGDGVNNAQVALAKPVF